MYKDAYDLDVAIDVSDGTEDTEFEIGEIQEFKFLLEFNIYNPLI